MVDVDVDLADVVTDNPLDDLAARSPGGWPLQAIQILRQYGAPRDLLEALDDWARIPVADETKLIQWQEWVAGTPGPRGKE